MTNSELSIATVAELTGIAKEVLRKWESRYGFPIPQRDPIGHRKFSPEQLSRLYLVKKLLNQGMQARHVVPLPTAALEKLLDASAPANPQASDPLAVELLTAMTANDPQALKTLFSEQLNRVGLRAFVSALIPSMNASVGAAWASGQVTIGNEHLYTETLKSLLAVEITRISIVQPSPRILLTTAPGEAHTLGLMMVHAILALEGVDCLFFGACLSCEEIAMAVAQYKVETVGLSFSDAFPVRKIVAFLGELRAQLPPATMIWAGGAGATRLQRKPPGVEVIVSLDGMLAVLRASRHQQTAT